MQIAVATAVAAAAAAYCLKLITTIYDPEIARARGDFKAAILSLSLSAGLR